MIRTGVLGAMTWFASPVLPSFLLFATALCVCIVNVVAHLRQPALQASADRSTVRGVPWQKLRSSLGFTTFSLLVVASLTGTAATLLRPPGAMAEGEPHLSAQGALAAFDSAWRANRSRICRRNRYPSKFSTQYQCPTAVLRLPQYRSAIAGLPEAVRRRVNLCVRQYSNSPPCDPNGRDKYQRPACAAAILMKTQSDSSAEERLERKILGIKNLTVSAIEDLAVKEGVGEISQLAGCRSQFSLVMLLPWHHECQSEQEQL
jgi:hypothetical protein